jgi:hypothetical protein
MSNEDARDAADLDFSEMAEQFKSAPINEIGVKAEDDNYEVVVDKAYTARSKNGHPMIKWELTIVSGQRTGAKFAHRKLFRNNMLTSVQNMTWLKTDLLRCGYRVDDATQIPNTLGKLKGLHLRVTQKTNGDNVNTYINSVVIASANPTPEKTVVAEALSDFEPSKTEVATAGSDHELPF